MKLIKSTFDKLLALIHHCIAKAGKPTESPTQAGSDQKVTESETQVIIQPAITSLPCKQTYELQSGVSVNDVSDLPAQADLDERDPKVDYKGVQVNEINDLQSGAGQASGNTKQAAVIAAVTQALESDQTDGCEGLD